MSQSSTTTEVAPREAVATAAAELRQEIIESYGIGFLEREDALAHVLAALRDDEWEGGFARRCAYMILGPFSDAQYEVAQRDMCKYAHRPWGWFTAEVLQETKHVK